MAIDSAPPVCSDGSAGGAGVSDLGEYPRALREFAVAVDRLTHWLRRSGPTLRWSAAGFTTLDTLARDGSRRITELADHERLSQPGMTELVRRLEGAGLVERNPDPRDGRATLVAVTDSGLEYLASVHSDRADLLAARVRMLSDDERSVLFAATPVLLRLAEPDREHDE